MTSGPVVVVGSPGGGSSAIANALGASPQLRRVRGEGPRSFVDDVAGLDLSARGFESHRLTAVDAHGRGDALRHALDRRLEPGEGRPLLDGPRFALRVGLLAEAFPDARFVLVQADPARALERSIRRWRAAAPEGCIELPGWSGPRWTLPVVPGWAKLAGLPLEHVAARQWTAIHEALVTDLQALDADRWCRVVRADVVSRPHQGMRRLAAFLELDDDPAMAAVLETASRRTALTIVGRADVGAVAPTADDDAVRRDVAGATHSLRFGAALRRLGGPAVVALPEAGTLTTLELRGERVMGASQPVPGINGVATHGDRMVVSTPGELWDLRRADGTFTLRSRHLHDVTAGDVVLAGDETWVVVDDPWRGIGRLDPHRGVVPHWTAPAGTRLGGIALDGQTPRWAALLDGTLIELGVRRTLATGLDSPRTPRVRGDRLWIVERDALTGVHLTSGARHRIAVPGSCAGLAIRDGYALVGGRERTAGTVWAVDLDRRAVIGFARSGGGSGTVSAVAIT